MLSAISALINDHPSELEKQQLYDWREHAPAGDFHLWGGAAGFTNHPLQSAS